MKLWAGYAVFQAALCGTLLGLLWGDSTGAVIGTIIGLTVAFKAYLIEKAYREGKA